MYDSVYVSSANLQRDQFISTTRNWAVSSLTMPKAVIFGAFSFLNFIINFVWHGSRTGFEMLQYESATNSGPTYLLELFGQGENFSNCWSLNYKNLAAKERNLSFHTRIWSILIHNLDRDAVATSFVDPLDPHDFGPPGSGSGSISQRYGSGNGSFHH